MAPRRSTRVRKPVVTTFDFDPSDEEPPRDQPTPRTKKTKRAAPSDDDAAFEAPAGDEAPDPEDQEEPAPEESDGSPSEAPSVTSETPRRALPGRDRRTQGTADPNAIEPYPFSKKTTRAYEGPLKRQRKTPYILEYMYGPDEAHTQLACEMLGRWYGFDVRPGRAVDEESGPMVTPWVRGGFEGAQVKRLGDWMGRWRGEGTGQRITAMGAGSVEGYMPKPRGDVAALLGPYGDQDELIFKSGEGNALALDDLDLPIPEGGYGPTTSRGWVFDVGGLVPSLSWAPQATSSPQYLALCVLPHSDQDHPNTAEPEAHKGSRSQGIIQIWRFTGSKTEAGEMVPTVEPAVLVRTLCFDWGRARRVKWCPVPSADESVFGLLAILAGDGQIRVVEVSRPGDDEKGSYVKIEEPMATLSIPDEQGVEATAFAWANTNRLVAGYTDGSIALWSLYPLHLLSRHPLHHTYIIDLATGYPSRPYLVTSVPVCGLPTLVDLTCPSYETSSFVRTSITTQPHLLQWNDHLQGFFSNYPSGSVLETSVSFMHHRYFPHLRRVIDVPGQLTCLSSGYTHPFLLVGLKDGSVWACNASKKLFALRTDKPMKQKIFEHEYRPADRFLSAKEGVSGAARILSGWEPEQNTSSGVPKKKRGKGGRKKGGKKGDGERMDVDGEEAVAEIVGAEGKASLVNHEPLTRITVMEWNPNLECGCWAAVAAASGIVRVMDLGEEPEPEAEK